MCSQPNLPHSEFATPIASAHSGKAAEVKARGWQVLHVASNQEKRVAQQLSVRSIENYLPLYAERVKWTDRTVITERALFPGYVFARFAPQALLTVLTSSGVVRSLGNDEAHLVSDAELAKIRAGLTSGLLLRPHPPFDTGSQVRIRSGIFAGYEGLVTEFRQECKVVLTLAANRQCFSLQLDIADLEALKIPPATGLKPHNSADWSIRRFNRGESTRKQKR